MPYKDRARHRTYNAAQMRARRAKEAIDRNEIASYIAELESLIPPDGRPARPELEVIKWAWAAEPNEPKTADEIDSLLQAAGPEDYA